MGNGLQAERDRLVKEYQAVEAQRAGQATPVSAKKPVAFGMEMPEGFAAERPFASAAYETLKEGLAIPGLNLLDAASFGNIRGAVSGEEWPQPKTLPGRVLSGAGYVAGLVKSPIISALKSVKLPAKMQIPTIARSTLEGGARGAIAGAVASPPQDISNIKQRGQQSLIGGGLGAGIGFIAGSIQHALHTRPEKVNAIKAAMRDYWRKNSKEYARLLKQAGLEGGEIDPLDTLEYMEKTLVEKGVLDSAGQRVAAPQDKIARALFKSYERLRDSYLKSGGRVSTGEVVKSYRTMQAAGKKSSRFRPTALGAESRQIEQGIVDSFKDKLRNKGASFEKAQSLWSNFAKRFDLVNKHFNVWKSNLETGKGERTLSKIMSDGELRTVAEIITEETGIKLGADKVLSVLMSPSVRQLAATVGLMAAIIYAAKNLGKQFAGDTITTDTGGS